MFTRENLSKERAPVTRRSIRGAAVPRSWSVSVLRRSGVAGGPVPFGAVRDVSEDYEDYRRLSSGIFEESSQEFNLQMGGISGNLRDLRTSDCSFFYPQKYYACPPSGKLHHGPVYNIRSQNCLEFLLKLNKKNKNKIVGKILESRKNPGLG